MNKLSTYAFYGSLRRGMINYRQYQHGLDFLYEAVIPGYQLYALEEYPYAVRTNLPVHLLTAEIFKITDPAVERDIHDLEIGVGYYYDEIMARGGQVGIYLFKKAGSEALVKGGDWIKFFGSGLV